MKTNRKFEKTAVSIALPSHSRLLAVANRLERHPADAEDLLQEAYLRLLVVSTTDQIREVLPWMRSVMKNLLTDKIRRNGLHDRFVALSLNGLNGEEPTSVTSIVERRMACALALQVMVERLDSHELAALLLREVFELNYRELAESLVKSEQATRQIVHRAWRRFRSNERFVKQRKRQRDDSHFDRIYLICLHSLIDRDPEGLHGLVSAPNIQASKQSLERVEKAGSKVKSVIQHVGGNLSMTIMLDGVILCVIPLGVTQNAMDSEFES